MQIGIASELRTISNSVHVNSAENITEIDVFPELRNSVSETFVCPTINV